MSSNCDDLLQKRVQVVADDEGRVVLHSIKPNGERVIDRSWIHRKGDVGASDEQVVSHGLSNIPDSEGEISIGYPAAYKPACVPGAEERLVFEDLVYVRPCLPPCFAWTQECGDEPVRAAERREDKIVADKLKITPSNYGQLGGYAYSCCGPLFDGHEFIVNACTDPDGEIPDHRTYPTEPIPDGPGQYPCFGCDPGNHFIVARWTGEETIGPNTNFPDDCWMLFSLNVRWVVTVYCSHSTSTEPWTCDYIVQVDMFQDYVSIEDELPFDQRWQECCTHIPDGGHQGIHYFRGCATIDNSQDICGLFSGGVEVHVSSLEHHSLLHQCENCGFDVVVELASSRDHPLCKPCFDLEPDNCPFPTAQNPDPDFKVVNVLEVAIITPPDGCSEVLSSAAVDAEACPTLDPHGCTIEDPCWSCPNPPANSDAALVAVWHSQPNGFGSGETEDAAVVSATVKIWCWTDPNNPDVRCHSLEVDLCIDAVIEGNPCCERCSHYRGCVDNIFPDQRCGMFIEGIEVPMRCVDGGDDCKGCELTVKLTPADF